jgi:hypothetical protein
MKVTIRVKFINRLSLMASCAHEVPLAGLRQPDGAVRKAMATRNRSAGQRPRDRGAQKNSKYSRVSQSVTVLSGSVTGTPADACSARYSW